MDSEYISEAGMEMETARAIKWLGNCGEEKLYEIMRHRFESNHLQFNYTRLAEIVARRLADFR